MITHQFTMLCLKEFLANTRIPVFELLVFYLFSKMKNVDGNLFSIYEKGESKNDRVIEKSDN